MADGLDYNRLPHEAVLLVCCFAVLVACTHATRCFDFNCLLIDDKNQTHACAILVPRFTIRAAIVYTFLLAIFSKPACFELFTKKMFTLWNNTGLTCSLNYRMRWHCKHFFLQSVHCLFNGGVSSGRWSLD